MKLLFNDNVQKQGISLFIFVGVWLSLFFWLFEFKM